MVYIENREMMGFKMLGNTDCSRKLLFLVMSLHDGCGGEVILVVLVSSPDRARKGSGDETSD